LPSETYQNLLCRKDSALHLYCLENKINFTLISNHFFSSIKTAKIILKTCKKKNIKIIHIHDSKAQTYAVLSQVLYSYKIPIIISRKVTFLIKNSFLTTFKYNYKTVKNIICISTAVKDIIVDRFPSSNTTTIMDGININVKMETNYFRNKYNLDKDDVLVGYVASMTDEKDHYTFLKTAKLILKENKKIKFLLIGDGKNIDKLIDFSKQNKIIDSIIFTGFIKNVNTLLSDLDLCLFTSKNEGLGSSILDFFLAKVPVVSTNSGGIKEIIIENETGLLCCIGDEVCLSNKVIKILEDIKMLEYIVDNAFNYVTKHHSLEVFSRKHLEVYNKILN